MLDRFSVTEENYLFGRIHKLRAEIRCDLNNADGVIKFQRPKYEMLEYKVSDWYVRLHEGQEVSECLVQLDLCFTELRKLRG